MNLTDVLLELRAQSDDGGHHQTCIPTGSSDLNMILGGTSQGIPRKTVTVISGPPGTGKTAIALDLTAHTLTTGQRAVWLTTNDMALPVSRLTSHALYEDCTLRLLTHIAISSLSQVLMLFKTPPYYMPPRHTGLVIVDDLSSLVSDAYTLSSSLSTVKKGNYSNEKKILEMANRRARALRNVLRAMKSFAETYNVAVVVLGGVVAQHSFMKGTQVLVPALGDGDWNKFVAGNIVLYKDIIQEEKYDEKYPYEKDDDDDNDKKEQEEEMVGYNTWYRQLKKENQKSTTTTTTIELPVCHAARISHFNDLDPAILHQQGVALFDITSQGIRNFLPSSTFSSQRYNMIKKKRQQSIEPIDNELVVKRLKSDEEKEEKQEEDIEKSNQLKMNNNNDNNDNDDIIDDDDDFNRVSEISATDSSPETLKPI